MAKSAMLILTNNHFDPTWRRCWDRRLNFRGQKFVSYAELEDYYMTDNLKIAREHPGYAFEAESTVVARKYLERHPERREELRKLASQGRFAVPGSGDNIIDSNMVLGESIVRNYLTGLLWVEENLGVTAKHARRSDAFGNSAQLPQILRGCELDWVFGLGYSPAQGKYWRGLDGSTVCHAFLSVLTYGSTVAKYRPCPSCNGEGCGDCDERGIDISFRTPLPEPIGNDVQGDWPAGYVSVASEEGLPNPEIIEWARSMSDRYDVRFAVQDDAYPWLKDWIDRVDDPPEELVHPSVELNPNNTGVFVTRIKTKQNCRRQEHALLGAEALCALAASTGADLPREELTRTWQTLLFTMFHDAITATHVDAAYEELQDMWTEIDHGVDSLRSHALGRFVKPDSGTISVINTLGIAATEVVSVAIDSPAAGVFLKGADGAEATVVRTAKTDDGKLRMEFVARDVPAMGASVFSVSEKSEETAVTATDARTIENERFRIDLDENGILAIVDKRSGAVVSAVGDYRPNELVIERDEGSPWATLHPDRTRKALADATKLVSVKRGPGFQSATFACDGSNRHEVGQATVIASTTVTLYSGIERVDFKTEVDWDAINVRLRVAMPVCRPGRGVYGIPYGAIERQPYEPNFHNWTAANGDWPAVDWAGVEGSGVSLALLNKGLPSYTIEINHKSEQTMFLSVLRSPHVPTYLHEPYSYVMTDYDGMRDTGSHCFEYALKAYDTSFAESSVSADAEAYNAGLLAVQGKATLPEAPHVESHVARMSALKWAEQGDAMILRLWEYRGIGGTAHVSLPSWVKSASKVNLLERGGEKLEVRGGWVEVGLRPWEIATLRLEL